MYVKELKTWLGQHFSDWFSNERVRRELLPQAEGEIVVDLEKREVLWFEGEILRSRPLERSRRANRLSPTPGPAWGS